MRPAAGMTLLAAAAVIALQLSSGPKTPGAANEIGAPPVRAKSSAIEGVSNTGFGGGCSAFDGEQKGISASSTKNEAQGPAAAILKTFLGAESPTAGIHYAIALTDDPIHTNLSLSFDRELGAIQQAAQDDGYTYNSSWLPWSNEPSTFSSLQDAESEAAITGRRESCPGILLFRRSSLGSQFSPTSSPYENGLIVFVVGEQPTGGLNEEQWKNAIHWLANHAGEAGAAQRKGDPSLHVLGPTFSGTLASLERALGRIYAEPGSQDEVAFRAKFPGVWILSGSIRSCNSIRGFERQIQSGTFHDSVHFGSFQENDAVQIDRFLRYLKQQGTYGRDVAIVAEDETAYANSALGAPVDPKADSDFRCDFPYAYENRPLRLSYPRDISALRTAYEKESIFGTTSTGQRSSRTILHRSDDQTTESPREATDTVATFSGQLDPVAQEAVLYGIVSYLRTHHARYILLRCSNQLDFLFLTRFFHRAYPEGRIVTVGSDLLFRREIDSTEFRGVMALSAYPLLPRDQHWTALDTQSPVGAVHHAHRVFEDQSQQGEYIAGRYLFSTNPDPFANIDSSTGADKTSPTQLTLPLMPNLPGIAEPFWLSDSGELIGPAHAPTWLSVVGRDGYWPLAVMNETHMPEAQLAEGKDSDGPGSRPSPTIVQLTHAPNTTVHYDRNSNDPNRPFTTALSWKLCTGIALILLSYQAIALRFGTEHAATHLVAGFRKTDSHSQSFLLGLNSAVAVLLLLEPLSLMLALPPSVHLGSGNIIECLDLALAAVAILGLGLLLHSLNPRYALMWYLISLGFFVALSLVTLGDSAINTNDYALAQRIGHPTSGVSPLLPVLFLFGGFYLWSWQTMAGNALLGAGHPILPRLRTRQIALGWMHRLRNLRRQRLHETDRGTYRLGSSEYRLSHEVGRRVLYIAAPFALPAAVLVPVLLLLGGAYFFFRSDLPLLTMESQSFSRCVNFAFLAAYLLTTAEAGRLIATWGELHRLLTALNRTRLKRTFARLRAIDAHSLWNVSGDVRRVQTLFFFQQLDAATRLHLVTNGYLPSVRAAVLFGRRFARHNASKIDSGFQWDDKIRERLADAVADTLNNILIPAWKMETDSLNLENIATSTGDDDGHPQSMKLSQDEAVRDAEEFVCFHYIAFIQNVLARMRTMTLSMASLFVAVCLAISFYPFVPRTEIGLWMMADLALIGLCALYVYAAMDRDATLSYIANTQPGRLSSTFWLKSAAFLAGPVIGILTTQFPTIADSVLAWVQPGLDAISK